MNTQKEQPGKNFRRRSAMGHLQALVVCAFLVALSIVMGKYLQIPVGQVLRFSFENFPIILAGIIFGPITGAAVGACADLIGCVLVGYAINPILTVGACAIGFLGGLAGRASIRLSAPLWLSVLAAELSAHTVGSVLIKSLGLSAFYSFPLWELMLWRLLNYTIVGVAEFALLFYLLRNRTIASYIRKFGGKI